MKTIMVLEVTLALMDGSPIDAALVRLCKIAVKADSP